MVWEYPGRKEAAVAGGKGGGRSFLRKIQNTHSHTQKSLKTHEKSKGRKRGGRGTHEEEKRPSPELELAGEALTGKCTVITQRERKGEGEEEKEEKKERRKRGERGRRKKERGRRTGE